MMTRPSTRIGRAVLAAVLFVGLVLIALFVRDDVIRPLGGDLLVVIFLYFALRAASDWSRWVSAAMVLIFALAVEVSQAFGLVERLGLAGNRLAEVVIGATYDPKDLLAYAIGVVLAVSLDRR